MELKFVDPRSLKDNPDKARRSKSSPQADALLLATIKAIGVVEPLIVFAEADGGNGFVIDQGHRRAKQAILAGLEQIAVLVVPRAEDGGAMRSLATSITHEQLNPVDLWRAIERLVALNWTEESIAIALAQSVRQIKKLRLLANVLPAMLDAMAKGDMPNEQQLRTIATASLEEQKEVWKANKPSKGDPQVSWWSVANGLTKRRMRVAARGVLIDVLSCRENISKSGIVAIVAGSAVGADSFLSSMGTEDFLSCLSRPALEASCSDTPVLPRTRVKDTRAALVEHFKEGRFVHPAALFAPDATGLAEWLAKSAVTEVEDDDGPDAEGPADEDQVVNGEPTDELEEGYREAAE